MATYRTRHHQDERRRRARQRSREEIDDHEYEDERTGRPNNFGWAIAIALIAVGIFLLAQMNNDPSGNDQAGTQKADSTAATQPPTVPQDALGKQLPAVGRKNGRKEASAIKILQQMSASYAGINTYEDQARMQLRYPVGNQIQEENAELSLKFQRPNQLRLEVSKEGHRVVVVNTGAAWHARIIDETTDNFDNQYVIAEADENPTVNAIYTATEYVNLDRPNELLNALMSLPAPLLVSQVAFLLEPTSLDRMIESSNDIRQMSEQSTQGRMCDRIRVGTDGGSFVFWVDQLDQLLRRIQFPTADRQPGDPTTRLGKAMLQCDYGRLRFPANFPVGTFELAKPANVNVVRNFILPPLEDPDSALNKQVDGFWFTDLRNERTLPTYWQNKLGVFIWWNNHPLCRASLESLAETYDKYKDDRRVAMLAVSSIPSTQMSHQAIQQLADDWDLALPVVRDLEAFGRDKFNVSQAPTIVIIDREGRVQLHELGDNPEIGSQITTVIQKLLDGENLAEQYLQFLAARHEKYKKLLAAASLEEPRIELQPAAPEVSPAKAPSRLTIRELWTNDKIERPGNVTVIRQGLRHRLLVHSNANSLVELTNYGSLQDRIELRTPAGSVLMTELRAAQRADGQPFYLAFAAQGDGVHVFDDRWQHVLTYPDRDAGETIETVRDARIADLDGDGDLELYVAFDDTGGVHRVSWQGRRQWTNQTVAPVLSLAISPDRSGQNYLLVTNDRGKILPLDTDGAPQKPISVPSWSIHHLIAAPAGQATANGSETGYCGLSQMPDGSLVAVGLSPSMSELWNEPLSRGNFASPIDSIQAVRWDNLQFWLIATPEGAIHIVSQDGQLHDRFQTGRAIRGLSGFQTADSNILIATSDQGVTAWQVGLPAGE